ncbi:hypothetical protein B0H19DRAFT_941079, partial [Mycena capillaripes]
PAPCGVPQVEVTFDIEGIGIPNVSVSATNRKTTRVVCRRTVCAFLRIFLCSDGFSFFTADDNVLESHAYNLCSSLNDEKRLTSSPPLAS